MTFNLNKIKVIFSDAKKLLGPIFSFPFSNQQNAINRSSVCKGKGVALLRFKYN